VGADADTALVEEVAIIPANVNDGKAGPDALPDDPGEVFADRRALKPGMSRSTAFAATSRRSLESGSAATAFGACSGEGWQRPVYRSASPQSSTTSSAAQGFSPRPDGAAKRLQRSATSAPISQARRSLEKTNRIPENDDPRTGLISTAMLFPCPMLS
jgi:hypothetical protein